MACKILSNFKFSCRQLFVAIMSFFTTVPSYIKYVYKLTGVLQFSVENTFWSRLWCLPFYIGFLCLATYFNLVSPHRINDILEYMNYFGNFGNIVYTSTSIILFCIRSNKIKLLLTKLDNMVLSTVLVTSNRSKRRVNWRGILLFLCFLVNFSLNPYSKLSALYMMYIWIPEIIYSSDTLFLADILNYFGDKFESINRNLQRQIDAVDLFSIFPLTNPDKIKILEEDDINFNIQRIQELSHFHYELVSTAVKIGEIFGITIVMTLILWFESIIETIYYVIYITINDEDNTLVNYAYHGSYVMFMFCWLFVLVTSFSDVQNKVFGKNIILSFQIEIFQANATSTYVHDIWNKYALTGKINVKTRHLQLVSTRLLNTKLHFTAMDFFSLDWTLYHMVNTNENCKTDGI
jgi:hypothetical protein